MQENKTYKALYDKQKLLMDKENEQSDNDTIVINNKKKEDLRTKRTRELNKIQNKTQENKNINSNRNNDSGDRNENKSTRFCHFFNNNNIYISEIIIFSVTTKDGLYQVITY